MGLGSVALSGMMKPLVAAAQPDLHFPAKAKRIIFLFMAGAPSQLDLFDYKPSLEKLHGQPLPKEISRGQRVTVMTHGKDQVICASVFKFAPQGQSGLMMSELLPHLSQHADDICMIKSLTPMPLITILPKPFSAPGRKCREAPVWAPGSVMDWAA